MSITFSKHKEYSIKEVADIIDCSESSVRRLLKRGELRYTRVVGIRIPGEYLDSFIRSRTY